MKSRGFAAFPASPGSRCRGSSSAGQARRAGVAAQRGQGCLSPPSLPRHTASRCRDCWGQQKAQQPFGCMWGLSEGQGCHGKGPWRPAGLCQVLGMAQGQQDTASSGHSAHLGQLQGTAGLVLQQVRTCAAVQRGCQSRCDCRAGHRSEQLRGDAQGTKLACGQSPGPALPSGWVTLRLPHWLW